MKSNKAINSAQKERSKAEGQLAVTIQQRNLWCDDCKYKTDVVVPGDISKCLKYKQKPNQVLCGGECKEYRKDKN